MEWTFPYWLLKCSLKAVGSYQRCQSKGCWDQENLLFNKMLPRQPYAPQGVIRNKLKTNAPKNRWRLKIPKEIVTKWNCLIFQFFLETKNNVIFISPWLYSSKIKTNKNQNIHAMNTYDSSTHTFSHITKKYIRCTLLVFFFCIFERLVKEKLCMCIEWVKIQRSTFLCMLVTWSLCWLSK